MDQAGNENIDTKKALILVHKTKGKPEGKGVAKGILSTGPDADQSKLGTIHT